MGLTAEVDGVKVKADYPATEKEIHKYIEYLAAKHKRKPSDIRSLTLKLLDDNEVDTDCVFAEQKFERIRRITGYLVGTTDRWNNAKQAELHDRVKHA